MFIEKYKKGVIELIKKYTRKEMGIVWSDQTKYQTWLDVEIAAVVGKANFEIYKRKIADEIKANANFTVDQIEELDKILEHDLQAFIEVVRSYLPEGLHRYVHEDMTSYDTEVPALALQFLQAGKILIAGMNKLIKTLRLKASEHMWTYCMGITHGKDAKPTTFGWRLCGYLEMLEKGKKKLKQALNATKEVKFSGAVGNNLTISPELELEVCRILGLKVRHAATQIVGRDVFARVLSEVATIGGIIEKMATDLRFLASSKMNEIREPRKPGQKGSSAMPHKRNPIILERMSGMAILLRSYASAGQELIKTLLERDIAHSCVERIIFPDAFILLDYILNKMTWIIGDMDVFRDTMAQHIVECRNLWASEEVKTFLCKNLDTDEVYKFLQTCAFEAEDEDKDFRDVLFKTPFPTKHETIDKLVDANELRNCFEFIKRLRKNLPTAYKRMELDESMALPPNIN